MRARALYYIDNWPLGQHFSSATLAPYSRALRGDGAANEEALEEAEDMEACLLCAPLLAKDSEEALRDMVSGEPATPAAPASASPACRGFT